MRSGGRWYFWRAEKSVTVSVRFVGAFRGETAHNREQLANGRRRVRARPRTSSFTLQRPFVPKQITCLPTVRTTAIPNLFTFSCGRAGAARRLVTASERGGNNPSALKRARVHIDPAPCTRAQPARQSSLSPSLASLPPPSSSYVRWSVRPSARSLVRLPMAKGERNLGVPAKRTSTPHTLPLSPLFCSAEPPALKKILIVISSETEQSRWRASE